MVVAAMGERLCSLSVAPRNENRLGGRDLHGTFGSSQTEMVMDEGKGLGQAIRAGSLARLNGAQRKALDEVHSRCEEEGECWLWQRSVNSSGYPQFRVGGTLKMVRTYLMTEVLGLQIPAGWWATTKCRNKRCCSPACLVALPRGTVMERSYEAGARPTAVGYADRLSAIVAQGITKLGFEGAKFVREDVMSLSASAAGELLGVSKSTVCRARRGESWRTVHPSASVFAWAASSVA